MIVLYVLSQFFNASFLAFDAAVTASLATLETAAMTAEQAIIRQNQ